MGIIRRTISKFFNKTEELIGHTLQKDNSKFEMALGKKLTLEEIIEENKIIISTLDPKLMFLVHLISEVKQEDMLQIIAENSLNMDDWLAHITYKTKMENFNNLLNGRNLKSLDPNALVPKKHRKEFSGKTIKCLTDLPLQKSLLN